MSDLIIIAWMLVGLGVSILISLLILLLKVHHFHQDWLYKECVCDDDDPEREDITEESEAETIVIGSSVVKLYR